MEKNQNLNDHLKELRVRLIRSLWAVLIVAAVAYAYSEQLFEAAAATQIL